MSPRSRLLVVAFVLVASLGLLAWLGFRSRAGSGALAAVALPDAPSKEEAALIASVESARSDDPGPARQLGEHYFTSRRVFPALWQYAEALRARPDDTPATLGLARALESALLPGAAIERLRTLLARRPDEAAARTQLAELLLRTGEPEAALAALRPLLAAASSEETGNAVLEGRVRQALGDSEGARRAYRRAVADPAARDAAPWHRLGLLELERRDLFNARQALGAARVLNGSEPRFAVDFGRTYAVSSKPDEEKQALKYYVEAMNQNLHFAPAHLEAGRWYLRHRRWKEAARHLRLAVDAAPNDADAHEEFALALEAEGKKAEARRHRGIAYDLRDLRLPALRELQAWATLAPSDPEAELEVAQGYFRTNQRVAAREKLVKARARFGADRTIRERLIAMSLLLGDREPVRALTGEWLKEEPEAHRALWLQGRAAVEEQRFADAVALYERALRKDPENPEYLGALGEALLKQSGQGAPAQALPLLARAATRAPEEKRWRLALAQSLQRAGRLADARRQCLRALDLDPLLSEAYFLAARLASAEGSRGAAALYSVLVRRVETRVREETPLYEATWKRPNDVRAYRVLADFLTRHGDLKAAAGQLAQAARLEPSAENRARLARMQRLLAVQ